MGVELSLMMVLSMVVPVNQLAQFFAVGGWKCCVAFVGFLYNMMYFKHLFSKGFVSRRSVKRTSDSYSLLVSTKE